MSNKETDQDFLSGASPATSDELGEFLSKFQEEAFRLELLDEYSIEEESEGLRRFRNNEKPDPSGQADWLNLLNSASKRNAIVTRVRRASIPASEYLRYEMEWGYEFSIQAGEKIYILDQKLGELSSLAPCLCDFWIFDRKICVLLHYDLVGRYLGASKLNPDSPHFDKYLQLMDKVKSMSTEIEYSKVWKNRKQTI